MSYVPWVQGDTAPWATVNGNFEDHETRIEDLEGAVAPVLSVNGETGTVVLDAADVSAIPSSYLDTDTTLAANSDTKVATQKATKAYVDASGGLTNFDESVNSSAPNGSRPVVYLSPDNAASTADIALVPKGSDGGLSLAVPDNTSTGGNKRGTKAVDFQLTRGAAAQVASGTRSAILGGTGNTASGQDSVIVGGASNTASAQESGVFCGSSHTVSAQGAVAIGGSNAVLSGDASVGVCKQPRDQGVKGVFAQGNANASAQGQRVSYVLDGFASGTTTKTLTTNNSTANATSQVALVDKTAYYVTGMCVARRSGTTTDSRAWTFKALLERNGAAANTRIVGSAVTAEYNDAGAAGWTLALSADTTNGCLKIDFTGDTGGQFYYVTAVADSVQVQAA